MNEPQNQGATVIQLGRYGDIISLLPALFHAFREGRKPRVVAARPFVDLFGAISYADSIPFGGEVDDPQEAFRRAKARKLNRPVIAQACGRGFPGIGTNDNFQRRSWEKVGYDHLFMTQPLAFDRRDFEAERKLVETWMPVEEEWRPTLLVCLNGWSAPLPDKTKAILQDAVHRRFADWRVVDLGQIRARRIDNLLGLLDVADALLTIDTAVLHLAEATNIPVVALVNDKPWLAAARKANHIVRVAYKEVTKANVDLLMDSLRECNEQLSGKIVHAYPEWEMNPDDRRRWRAAFKTWVDQENSDWSWKVLPVDYAKKLPRTSKSIGDKREVPFVKDMIEYAFASDPAAEAVVLTNSDVGWACDGSKSHELYEGAEHGRSLISQLFRRALRRQGAAYSWRVNFDVIDPELIPTYQSCVSALQCGGLDCFAFTRDWWERNKENLPDMLMGNGEWDLVYRDYIRSVGGAELYGINWHERHQNAWNKPKLGDNPGNDYNQKLGKEWTAKFDRTRPYKNL